jgi:pyruvate/2-oxoglutarate dehydrogenase complex dihydrolipoamide acyltransferase (E2) component
LVVRGGDAVEAGQPLAVVEADKAMMEIAAPGGGVVLAIDLDVGDTAAVGVTFRRNQATAFPA